MNSTSKLATWRNDLVNKCATRRNTTVDIKSFLFAHMQRYQEHYATAINDANSDEFKVVIFFNLEHCDTSMHTFFTVVKQILNRDPSIVKPLKLFLKKLAYVSPEFRPYDFTFQTFRKLPIEYWPFFLFFPWKHIFVNKQDGINNIQKYLYSFDNEHENAERANAEKTEDWSKQQEEKQRRAKEAAARKAKEKEEAEEEARRKAKEEARRKAQEEMRRREREQAKRKAKKEPQFQPQNTNNGPEYSGQKARKTQAEGDRHRAKEYAKRQTREERNEDTYRKRRQEEEARWKAREEAYRKAREEKNKLTPDNINETLINLFSKKVVITNHEQFNGELKDILKKWVTVHNVYLNAVELSDLHAKIDTIIFGTTHKKRLNEIRFLFHPDKCTQNEDKPHLCQTMYSLIDTIKLKIQTGGKKKTATKKKPAVKKKPATKKKTSAK